MAASSAALNLLLIYFLIPNRDRSVECIDNLLVPIEFEHWWIRHLNSMTTFLSPSNSIAAILLIWQPVGPPRIWSQLDRLLQLTIRKPQDSSSLNSISAVSYYFLRPTPSNSYSPGPAPPTILLIPTSTTLKFVMSPFLDGEGYILHVKKWTCGIGSKDPNTHVFCLAKHLNGTEGETKQ